MASLPQPIRIVSKGLKTQVFLPDGTEITRQVRSIRWEHNPHEAPRVFLEFLAPELDVEAFTQGESEAETLPLATAEHAIIRNAVPAGLARERLRDTMALNTERAGAMRAKFL